MKNDLVNQNESKDQSGSRRSGIAEKKAGLRPRSSYLQLQHLVGMALFAALAYILMLFIRFPVSFLTLDVKDAVITLAAFLYGPLAGPVISLLVSALEAVTVSSTGFYGFLMNFAGSAVFSLLAGLVFHSKKTEYNGLGEKIRRPRKSYRSAIVGLYLATFAMTAVMLLMNLWITPLYSGVPFEGVVGMLLPLLLPFNLAKGLLNSVVVLLLYQPVLLGAIRAKAVRADFEVQKPAPRDLVLFLLSILLTAAIAVVGILIAKGIIVFS